MEIWSLTWHADCGFVGKLYQRIHFVRQNFCCCLTLAQEEVPLTESLKDVVARLVPYWHEKIAPAVRDGKRVLIAAHGNSLRALVKFLDKISDEKIVEVNIPTGIPLVYELEDDLTPVRSFYLGDQAGIETAIREVADQTSRR